MGLYPNNAADGTVIPNSAKLSPGGLQGPVGDVTGVVVAGDLSGTLPNPTLAASGAGPQNVGNATTVANVVTDAKGRVVALTAVPIAFPGGGIPSGAVPAGGDLTGTYPSPILISQAIAPGVYGSKTAIPVLTLDIKGRVISASVVSPSFNRTGVLGSLLPATLSTGAEQVINLTSTRCRITAIIAENANTNIAGNTHGGIGTASGPSGVGVVDLNTAWGGIMSSSSVYFNVPLDTPMSSTIVTTGVLYLKFGTFQNPPGGYTCNLWIIGEDYS